MGGPFKPSYIPLAMDLQTLVLNPSMQPHRIASWQEAICLVYTEKGDVLEEYEATVSSPSITFQVPAVIRLKKEMSLFKKGVKYSPLNIFTRDRHVCCYCGVKKKPREVNCDHVLPRVQGGKTTWTNIVTSCYPCNRKKGARTPAQAGMRMHYQPHIPKRLPLAPLILIKHTPDLWAPYLSAVAQTA